jgi:hypothetical protein
MYNMTGLCNTTDQRYKRTGKQPFSRIFSFCHKIVCDISIKWGPDNEAYPSQIDSRKIIRLVSLLVL